MQTITYKRKGDERETIVISHYCTCPEMLGIFVRFYCTFRHRRNRNSSLIKCLNIFGIFLTKIVNTNTLPSDRHLLILRHNMLSVSQHCVSAHILFIVYIFPWICTNRMLNAFSASSLGAVSNCS